MATLSLCILGGTGFVGAHLADRLIRDGHRLKLLARHSERHRDLMVLPGVRVVEANVSDPETLRREFERCDVVINLVGILNEKGHDGRGFHRVHVELAKRVVEACKAAGVQRLLHMSAHGADAEHGASHYLRTKGEAEKLVHASGLRVTTIRPSVIFGRGDSFFNRFGKLLRLAPGIFPLACAEARLQPVHVGDVVEVFAQSLARHATFGQGYDLCGPHVYTLQQLVEYTAHVLGLRRHVIPLSDRLSLWQARLLEYAPGKPFSLDNYRTLQTDNVCTTPWPALFTITPSAVESIVPGYLSPDVYL